MEEANRNIQQGVGKPSTIQPAVNQNVVTTVSTNAKNTKLIVVIKSIVTLLLILITYQFGILVTSIGLIVMWKWTPWPKWLKWLITLYFILLTIWTVYEIISLNTSFSKLAQP